MPVPDKIQNAPELNLGLEVFYNGFMELTSTRQLGMAMGPISTMSIMEYCILNEIDGEVREDFMWFVTRLDAKYLNWSKKT